MGFRVGSLDEKSPQPVYDPVAESAQDEELTVEEGRGFSYDSDLSAVENPDKAAFVDLINKLLWNHGEEVHVDARGFEHVHVQQGLFGRKMPAMFEDPNSFTGRMYNEAQDVCYQALCSYGFQGFFEQIGQVLNQIG